MKYPCPVCGKYCKTQNDANAHCRGKMQKLGKEAKDRWVQK